MMNVVKYTATKLKAVDKEGILKPDSDGYYTLVIGGLNVLNSAGEYYTLQGAKELFDRSSVFMRRVTSGNLKGEVGHPKREPGMNEDAYISRILRVEETNVCCHFKDVWLDENYGKNNPGYNNPALVAIMATVKPAGAKGDSLKQSLENKAENVCFSIRAMTKDTYIRGINNRVLHVIFTFDCVSEPGIAIANKWNAPALESINPLFITKSSIERIVNDKSPIAVESDKAFAKEVLNLYNTDISIESKKEPKDLSKFIEKRNHNGKEEWAFIDIHNKKKVFKWFDHKPTDAEIIKELHAIEYFKHSGESLDLPHYSKW